MKKQLLQPLLLGLVIVLGLGLLVAATTDRPGAKAINWSCGAFIDPIASQTDLETDCRWIAPMGGTIGGGHVSCATETSTAKTFKITDDNVIIATAELDAAQTNVPFVFTTTTVADESKISLEYTTAAGESATGCKVDLTLYP